MTQLLSRRTATTLIASAMLALSSGAATAQQYPSKPIRIVVPVPPGGGSDAIARSLGERLSASMKTPVVVENKPGAGGVLGSDLVAKAAPDGYTVLLINNAFVINPWLYKTPFNASKDFVPVALVGSAPNVLVAGPSAKVNTLQEFIAEAKRNPGKLTFAVSTGQMSHLGTAALDEAAGIDVQMIPYKGAGAGDVDLLSGVVNFSFGTAPTYLQQIKAGKLKALGVGSKTPVAALPGVPPIAQTLPGFEVETWFGLFAPAGTPPQIVDTLNREVAAALKQPAMLERLGGSGYTGGQLTREEFSSKVSTEMAKWGDNIKKRNIRVE